jgi:OFA family oxalate/formate antiporter-like MFS transporter
VESTIEQAHPAAKQKFFYGWYIVGVGFLANVASAFSLASTMSVFLKPLTADLGVSRGVFSLLRSGEGLIAAFLAPVIGTLMDRYGGRWLMVFGAIIASLGYIVLSHVDNFGQFSIVRLSLITIGDSFMGYIVINLAIAHWFLRKRGRALALTSMGIGFAKVGMPVLAASLIVWLGWRQTWLVFGIVTLVLVVGPALLIVRRSPEDMGLNPDGASSAAPKDEPIKPLAATPSITQQRLRDDIEWTRNEALHTQAFWLLVVTFGISSIGVTGLNLHVFPYVNDLGHPPVVAATVMSVIASMQLASPIAWGILAERIDTRFAATLRFVVQGIGLGLAVMTDNLFCLYAGFLLYGIGLGGNMVLPDILWADYFGRRSLGKVRGLGLLISQTVAALGPPFFGFLFDLTGAYDLSFMLFGAALITSAFLSLMLRPPVKKIAEQAHS